MQLFKIIIFLSTAIVCLAVSGEYILDQTLPETVSTCDSKRGGVQAFLCYENETNWAACSLFYKEGDLLAELYDIRYNGSLTFSVGGECPAQSHTTNHIYTLRIGNVGSIPGTNLSRQMWDDNPFWMGIYFYAPDGKDKIGDTYGHLRARSSSSRYIYSKYWDLKAEKLADGMGYSINGEMNSVKTPPYHELDYQYACGGFFSSLGKYSDYMIKGCTHESATMNGTVKAETAEATFTIVPHGENRNVVFTYAFSGQRVPGPKLVLDGPAPAATGSIDGAKSVIEASEFSDGTVDGSDGSDSSGAAMRIVTALFGAIAVPILVAFI